MHLLHSAPVNCGRHVHVPGAFTHVPFRHPVAQMADSQYKSDQPAAHTLHSAPAQCESHTHVPGVRQEPWSQPAVQMAVLQLVASQPGKHTLHDAPDQLFWHVHVLGAVQEPNAPQFCEQTATLHVGPVHPAAHVHVKAAVQLPFTHDGLQIAARTTVSDNQAMTSMANEWCTGSRSSHRSTACCRH